MSLPAVTAVLKPQQAKLGLDQQPLLDLGLREVRAYARELWSDHNVHDPGVTTLEVLCYALTDLCYRASYPIEDLLATPDDDRRSMAGQFFEPRAALPNAPLTELDYRKLLIDVEGVRNAWIHPVKAPEYYADSIQGNLLVKDPGVPGIRPLRMRGLYGALIEYQRDDLTPADKRRILSAARAALLAHRNLGEDFTAIEAVEQQKFLLCAEIEIDARADPTEAYAKILFAVQEHLAPGVPRHARAEMLERPKPDGVVYTDPELFEGPALEHGFIDDAELAAAKLRTIIRLSDVIALVMDIEGVVAVREMVIRPEDEAEAKAAQAESKWEVSVLGGKRSVLDPAHSRLVLYKGSMPLGRGANVLARYEELKSEAEQKFTSLPLDDPQIPLGRFRAATQYESVQKHFPAVYGIGDAALPPGADLARRAQARQLQGYLLFFDQLLANSFSQLGEVRQLFSRDPEVAQTYFYQRVAGLNDLYKPGAGTVELETPDAALVRRNRFLDHLIARIAERLPDDLQIQSALFGATPAAVARAKCAFLSDYPKIGSKRGLAFDYTIDPASGLAASNISGLERRLAHLLSLGTVAREIYQQRDAAGVERYHWHLRRRFADGVLLSSDATFDTHEQAAADIERAIAAATQAVGYQRLTTGPGAFFFNVVDGANGVIARRSQSFASAAECNAAIDELVTLLVAHTREHPCVIENILLRPRAGAKDTFLPICADPGCAEGCPGDDPYSYRLHIVLPATVPRFADIHFRRYAEQVIREETPAHLLPKICWVNGDDMSRVEKAWLAWRAVLAETDNANVAAKLEALSNALFNAKNVYPAPTLADCGAAEKFVLGRSVLGSEPPAPA